MNLVWEREAPAEPFLFFYLVPKLQLGNALFEAPLRVWRVTSDSKS